LLEELTPEPQPGIDWPLLARLPSAWPPRRARRACRELLSTAHEELKPASWPMNRSKAWCTRGPRFIDIVLRRLWAQQLEAGLGTGRWSRSAATAAASCTPIPTSTSCCWCRSRRQRRALPGRGLVSFLWDIGLEVGHSVRTVAQECAEESAADVGVMTTLLEARLLAGRAELLAAMRALLRPIHLAGEAVLRGEGARAERAASEGQRHRL
jgi:hypothetical protein